MTSARCLNMLGANGLQAASPGQTSAGTDNGLPSLIRSTSVIYRRDRNFRMATRAFLDVLVTAGPGNGPGYTNSGRYSWSRGSQ